MKLQTKLFLLVVFGGMLHVANAQELAEPLYNKKKLTFLVAGTATLYTGTLIGLNSVWYKDSGRQSFRFFNDNAEWKQVDKIGHLYSAFYLAEGFDRSFRWAGLSGRKAAFIGSLAGFALLVPIEIMDGYSDSYGASAGDLVADLGGAGLYLLQTRLWDEPRIYPKFSFHTTNYPELRPEILGNTTLQQIIKDYNGQTYWFTFDMDKFMRFPKWLDISVGYGAEKMVYARDTENKQAGYSAYRQFYLSPDIDLRSFSTRSKALKTLLYFTSLIKIPLPTLEVSQGTIKGHWLYF